MREKLMKNDLSKDLIPSEDEIKKIVAQMMMTNPAQIPVLLIQIKFARIMLKIVDKLRKDLSDAIEEFEDEINK